jgi:hypothetical protein
MKQKSSKVTITVVSKHKISNIIIRVYILITQITLIIIITIKNSQQ